MFSNEVRLPQLPVCAQLFSKNTIYVARLEACTKQKTAKNATEFTLHSTYTSTSVSEDFSVACHRWEAAAAAAPPPPLPPLPPRCLMRSQVVMGEWVFVTTFCEKPSRGPFKLCINSVVGNMTVFKCLVVLPCMCLSRSESN